MQEIADGEKRRFAWWKTSSIVSGSEQTSLTRRPKVTALSVSSKHFRENDGQRTKRTVLALKEYLGGLTEMQRDSNAHCRTHKPIAQLATGEGAPRIALLPAYQSREGRVRSLPERDRALRSPRPRNIGRLVLFFAPPSESERQIHAPRPRCRSASSLLRQHGFLGRFRTGPCEAFQAFLTSITALAVGREQMQRNFEPMADQISTWRASQLTDGQAKEVILSRVHRGRARRTETSGSA